MHRTPTGWSRLGNGGFVPIPQIDTPDEHDNGNQQPRRVTRRDFSSQVQQVLRRSALQQEQEHDHWSVQGSVHSSPAFSDTTLVGGDYLDVPIRHRDEVDLRDCIEYHGYYSPEVAGRSPTPSIKAGAGLEVCSRPVPSYLSPEGFYVDDPSSNLSYRGSEGKIEEEVPGEPQNYKPPILRKRFLLVLFLVLVILVGLAELAIQLLPDDSGAIIPSQAPNGTAEIRPRSVFSGSVGRSNPMEFFRRQNNTSLGSTSTETTSVTSWTETISDTAPTSTETVIMESSPTSTTLATPTLPGGDVSTDTTETSSSSTVVPVITSSSVTSSSTSSTSLTDPPLSSTSKKFPLPPFLSTTISGVEPPPPPPTSTTSENSPPPPETSSSSSTPPTLPSSPILSHPGHQVPTSKGDPLPSHTSDPSSFTSTTNPDGTSLPTTLPNGPTDPGNPPSSTPLPGPPNSEPTRPDPPSTGHFPTETMPTWVPSMPTSPELPSSSPNPPDGPGPDSSTTSSITLPFSSLIDTPSTTTDPPDATTLSSTGTSSTETSGTSTVSKFPDSSTELMTSIEQSSRTTSSIDDSPTSGETTTTTTNPIDTVVPLHTGSTLEPFTTIIIAPDTQLPPPPITTTIVTSVSQSNGIFIETTFISIINNVKAAADNAVTEFVSTYRDSHGKPTRTTTFLAQMSVGTGSVVLYPPYETILTDYQGVATKTEEYFISISTWVLYDKNHRPTATESSSIFETASLTTLFDSNGVATETRTELVPMSSTITTMVTLPTLTAPSSSKENKTLHVVPISDGKYFLGLMFPTFIAILVSIPIRIIDQTARLYQPFHALVSSRGAKACDTLCFPTVGTWSLMARIRALLNGQILLTLTGLLVLGSVILIPLSSEAVGIILMGPDCAASKGDTLTCSMVLGVYSARAQIAVALLAFMVILMGVVLVVLRNWNTGVKDNPWSLFYMVHLAANNEIKTLVQRRLHEKNGQIPNSRVNEAFRGISFVLDYWKDNGVLKYSILIPNEAHSLKKEGKTAAFSKGKVSRHRTKGNAMPFFILRWTGRLLFLALLCAIQIGLLVYIIAGDGQGYTQYMMGRWRVVRFIFTFIGVVVSLIWDNFFQAVAFLSPHKLFHRIRLYNGDAVKMTPPTNAFSGIRSSLTTGRRDVYLGVVSATSILSQVLPLLLSVSLDKCTETFWAHTVCLWMAVSVLSIMILTVAGLFFVSWPHMPIDPSIIAGGIYYAWTKYMPMSPSSGLLFGRASPGLV
ncbi:hypothetical protein F4805DRAFT_457334 [Annulohypoxylon moriforme]|nr:hypothetical protein F4805DRAFT_457334 [Annulohypoxylon moriforme]